MKEQDEIEELFSSAFADFERIPSFDVKSSIDEQIFNQGSNKFRKSGIFWILFSILMFGLIAVLSSHLLKIKGETNLFSSNKIDNEIQVKSQLNHNFSLRNDILIDNVETAVNCWKSESKVKDYTLRKLNKEIESIQNNISNKRNGISTNFGSIPSVRDRNYRFLKTDPVIVNQNQLNHFSDLSFLDALDFSDQKKSSNIIGFSSSIDSTKIESQISLKSDSLITQNNKNASPELLEPKFAFSSWSLSFYSGTTYGLSNLEQIGSGNFNMKEKFGFSSSFEINKPLNSRIGITSGFEFNSRTENFYQTVLKTDSVYTGTTEEFVYSSDTIIVDTIYVDHYTENNTEEIHDQIISHSSYAIPIYFTYNLATRGKWNFILSGGFRFSYEKNKILSNNYALEVPETRNIGFRMSIRPQLTYSLNQFGIGVYLNSGFDLISTPQWTSVNRKRFDLGLGILVRYQF